MSSSDTAVAPSVDTTANKKERLLTRLEKYRDWYERDKRRMAFGLFALQSVAMVCAFGASLIAALITDAATWTMYGKPAAIVLPALAGLAGVLITQFKLREIFELREKGRIDVEELRHRARALQTDVAEQFAQERLAIELNLVAIEREQAKGFFAYMAAQPTLDQESIKALVDAAVSKTKEAKVG
jgi:hypothetical protein